jgi:hypothetical protein
MRRLWAARLAWLVGIWACSVAALALVAWLMRLLFRSVGLA